MPPMPLLPIDSIAVLRRLRFLAFAVGLSFAGLAAHAETFVFKDWAVTCDNTRACEAIGFQAEASGSAPVELWLSRDAGPRTPVRARVTALVHDRGAASSFRIRAGKLEVTQPTTENLADAAAAKLVPAMLEAGSAEVQFGPERFTLSLAGLKAALLKMDDLQSRIGTPGALVRKGTQPESAVPPPIEADRPQIAIRFQNKSTDDRLLHAILPTLASTCAVPLGDEVDSADVSIHRVSESRVIVLRECRRHALQSTYAAWLADDKPPYAARRLSFPLIAGGSADEAIALQLDGVLMRSLVRLHDGNDCGSDAWWTWTAREEFELDNGHDSPLCRGMPEGGFALRTYIARR